MSVTKCETSCEFFIPLQVLTKLTSSPDFTPEIPTALKHGIDPPMSRFGGFLLLTALPHRSLSHFRFAL
jgi:hypothetical protein